MFSEMVPKFHIRTCKCSNTVPLTVLSDVRNQINWNLISIFDFEWTLGSKYCRNNEIYTRRGIPSPDVDTACGLVSLLYLKVKLWWHCIMYRANGLQVYGFIVNGNPEAENKTLLYCDRYCLNDRHVCRCTGTDIARLEARTDTKMAVLSM